MSEPTTRDRSDNELLELIDALARGDLEAASVAERRQREWVELFGLLGCEAEPLAFDPGLEERLLGATRGGFDEANAEDASRPRSGAWRLVAAVLLALVGTNGWLLWRAKNAERTVTRLESELEHARAEDARLAAAEQAAAEVRSRLDLVTSADTEYCPLRPPAGSAAPQARGTVIMQAKRDEWLLQVEGLGPAGEGYEYRLWFLIGDGYVAAAHFDVEAPDQPVQVHDRGLPAGMTGVMLTREPLGVENPRGGEPPLLFGDERLRIL